MPPRIPLRQIIELICDSIAYGLAAEGAYFLYLLAIGEITLPDHRPTRGGLLQRTEPATGSGGLAEAVRMTVTRDRPSGEPDGPASVPDGSWSVLRHVDLNREQSTPGYLSHLVDLIGPTPGVPDEPPVDDVDQDVDQADDVAGVDLVDQVE